MAERKCATCDQPVRSSALRICIRCQVELRKHLGMQGWAEQQLLIEFRRQARKHAQQRSNGGNTPIPFDDRAAKLLRRQRQILARYAGDVLRRRGVRLTEGPICVSCRHGSCKAIRAGLILSRSVTGAAEYLGRNMELLKRQHYGQTLLEQLRPLNADVIRVVDLPEMRSRFAAGPCPKTVVVNNEDLPCLGRVDANVPADERLPAYLLCNSCGFRWPSWEWNRAGSDILAREAQLALQDAMLRQFTKR